MGRRPTLNECPQPRAGKEPQASACAAPLATSARNLRTCDQAIFTSIRTPTSEGYRIIAASPGVRAEERVEITRRSPSHGGLCASGADQAVGLSSYRLDSGRHCVAYCRHAGYEHTARGGQRVYTHMALLDEAGYGDFNADPVAVHAVLGQVVGRQEPLLKSPPRLDPRPLSVPPPARGCEQAVPPAPASSRSAEWIWAVAAALLEGRRLILVGAEEPFPLLQWAMLSIPRCVRANVDASVGLQFSPIRQMDLVLLPEKDEQLRHRIAGRGVELWHADAIPPPPAPRLAPWFELLQGWWAEGQYDRIVRLTSQLCTDAPATDPSQLAAMREDIDEQAKTDGQPMIPSRSATVPILGDSQDH